MITTVKSSGCELLLELKNGALQPLGTIQEHAWEARGISIWKSIPQENQHGECQNSNMYTCIYASLCVCV